MAMKVGLYARVSKDEQITTNQLMELKEFAGRRGYNYEEYVDEGFSGSLTQDKRPQLKLMLEAARRGKIDMIVCWDLSRFARSIKQLVDMVEDLRVWNVGFTTVRENIDTTTPNGRLIFHIFAALAEFEKALIIERTLLGMKRARAQGKIFGRPKVQVDTNAILDLYQVGKSLRQIEAALGVSRMTISRALTTCKILSQNGSSNPVPLTQGKLPLITLSQNRPIK